MIRAKAGDTSVVWANGKLAISAGAHHDMLQALFAGGVAAFNPVLGGPYQGFDGTDPHQVMDALTHMRREGIAVTIEEEDFPRRVPAEYPGGLDTRSESSWKQWFGDPVPFEVDDEDLEDVSKAFGDEPLEPPDEPGAEDPKMPESDKDVEDEIEREQEKDLLEDDDDEDEDDEPEVKD